MMQRSDCGRQVIHLHDNAHDALIGYHGLRDAYAVASAAVYLQ